MGPQFPRPVVSAPPPPKRPNYTPILITLAASLILGGASCFGFLTTLNMNKSTAINTFLGVGFVLCVVTFLGSILWLLVRAIRDAMGD